MTELSFSAHYEHAEYPGIAFWLKRWEELTHYDWFEEDGEPTVSGMVIAVMVGDDREHVVDPDDLTELDEEAYCAECGQIGCTHDGRERT